MNLTIPLTPCKYGCGKLIFWDNSVQKTKIKFREADTGLLHNYPRCADLLKQQGKDVGVLKKK